MNKNIKDARANLPDNRQYNIKSEGVGLSNSKGFMINEDGSFNVLGKTTYSYGTGKSTILYSTKAASSPCLLGKTMAHETSHALSFSLDFPQMEIDKNKRFDDNQDMKPYNPILVIPKYNMIGIVDGGKRGFLFFGNKVFQRSEESNKFTSLTNSLIFSTLNKNIMNSVIKTGFIVHCILLILNSCKENKEEYKILNDFIQSNRVEITNLQDDPFCFKDLYLNKLEEKKLDINLKNDIFCNQKIEINRLKGIKFQNGLLKSQISFPLYSNDREYIYIAISHYSNNKVNFFESTILYKLKNINHHWIVIDEYKTITQS